VGIYDNIYRSRGIVIGIGIGAEGRAGKETGKEAK
jgi:hypothetical protein